LRFACKKREKNEKKFFILTAPAARIYLKFIHAKAQRAQRAQREEGKGKILIFFFSFVFLGVLGVLCAFAL